MFDGSNGPQIKRHRQTSGLTTIGCAVPKIREPGGKVSQLDALQAAVAAGNPAVTDATAAGQWSAACQAMKEASEAQEAARLASMTPAQQTDAALRMLAEHEQAAGSNPAKIGGCPRDNGRGDLG